MKKSLAVWLLAFTVFACDDAAPFPFTTSDYLVFGAFAGECYGDCLASFRVMNKRLEEDTTNQYYRYDYEFRADRELSSDAFEKAKVLMDDLPADLIRSDLDSYGCPDCADQGALFLMFEQAGEQRIIVLDSRDTDDQSAAIVAYKDRLQELILELRE